MHAKSDSEVTSLAPSSPPRSPRRPVYFVQSPSRDSHDGDSKISFQSTPLLTPIGSPLHPAFSARSRDSSRSSSQNFGHPPSRLKHGLRKILPQPHHDASRADKPLKPWAACSVIQEEPQPQPNSKASQLYRALLVLLSCLIFLVLFILFFWLICRPQHPQLFVKKVVFHNYFMGEATDASGVPTKMVTLNSTVQLIFRNPSKYFKVHINSADVALDYSELQVANGQINGHVQDKLSEKTISIVVQAVKVPLYGAGTSLPSGSDGSTSTAWVMVATVRSQFYVVGKLVKSKFQSQATCNLLLNPTTLSILNQIKSSCVYDPPH